MTFKDNWTIPINGYFLSSFMLGILGLGSIIFWGSSASFLVMEPFANLIHSCLRMIPAPKIFLLPGSLLLMILLLWLFIMAFTAYHQHRSLIRFLKGITFCSIRPQKLELAIKLSGITTPIDYTLDAGNMSFSYGLMSPRIVISQSVLQKLELDELCAILLHEESHSVHKDPMRLFLLRMFFSCARPVKIISKLLDYFLLTTEITADQFAMKRLGEKSWALGSALLKIVRADLPVPNVVIGATSVLENRIDNLIDPSRKPMLSVSSIDYVLLSAYLFLTFAFFLYSLQNLSIWLTCH